MGKIKEAFELLRFKWKGDDFELIPGSNLIVRDIKPNEFRPEDFRKTWDHVFKMVEPDEVE